MTSFADQVFLLRFTLLQIKEVKICKMALKTDDWKLCADWLVRCQILAPDHPVNQPSAEVFELAQILRDGVLLCHLVNRLKPGVVDAKEFSQRPQMSQVSVPDMDIFWSLCVVQDQLMVQRHRYSFVDIGN